MEILKNGKEKEKGNTFSQEAPTKTVYVSNCGYKAIKVNMENIPERIRIQCGKCGNMQVEKIGEKKTKINCFECGETIAKVKVSDTVETTCGICNFFEVTEEWSIFNCHCPPSKAE